MHKNTAVALPAYLAVKDICRSKCCQNIPSDTVKLCLICYALALPGPIWQSRSSAKATFDSISAEMANSRLVREGRSGRCDRVSREACFEGGISAYD